MQESESLVTEPWPVEKLCPFEDNPRVITDAAVGKVARSIQEFGWRQPIVVDPAGVVIVGHARLLAAQRLGLATVPVHVAHGLSEAQVRAYRLADNRTNEEAKWDPAKLAVNLEMLQDVGFDLGLTGFDPVELPTYEPPSFEPIPAGDVKPLDKRAPVKCPSCGAEFEP